MSGEERTIRTQRLSANNENKLQTISRCGVIVQRHTSESPFWPKPSHAIKIDK